MSGHCVVMGTQNTGDENNRKFVNCFSFSNWNPLLLDVDTEYTPTEHSDSHSPMSVFGYPQTPISAPGTSASPALSQFQLYPDPDPDTPFHLTGQLVDLDEEFQQWRRNSTQPPLPLPILYAKGCYYSANQLGDNWDGGYKPDWSGIEQNPVAEYSDAKRKLEFKANSKRPLKKPRALLSRQDLELQFGKTLKVAAECLKVSVSTLKRCAREHEIPRWPCNKKSKGNCNFKSPNSDQNAHIANSEKKEGVERFMIVKVKYKSNFVKFELSNLSKMADLREKVSKRLELNGESFQIKYMDEDDDWILLPGDDDLEYCMRSVGESTTIRMLVLPVTP